MNHVLIVVLTSRSPFSPDYCESHCFMLQSSVSCDMLVLCFMFLFYVIITNTMAYWYDGAALAATRSPVIALFWCLIKFTTTTTTTICTSMKLRLLANDKI